MADPRITWRLGVDDQVTRAVKGIDGQISGLTKRFASLGKLGAAGLFAGAVAGLTKLTTSTIELANELGDAAERFGVSVEHLHRLKQAAEASGASFEGLQTGLAQLSKKAHDAAGGSESAASAFRRLGIDAGKLAALPLENQLRVLGEQLGQLPAGSQRAAAAMEIFGSSGTKLLPLLSDLDGELGRVNSTLTTEQVAAIKTASDEWGRFSDKLKAFVAPAVAGALRELGKIPDFLEESLFKPIARLQKGREGFRGAGGSGSWGLSKDEAAAILGLPGEDVLAGLQVNFEATLASFNAALKAYEDERRRISEAAASDIAAIIERTRTPFENYRAGVERVTELHERWGLSTEATNRELERLGALLGAETQALVDATSAGQQWNRDHEDAADIIASLISPMDQLAERYRRIGELQAKGLLTPGQAGAAREDEVAKFTGDTDRMVEAASERTTRLLEEIRNASSGFARDLTQIMFNTTESIGDMFNRLGQRIAEAFIEIKLVQPLIDSILGSFGGSVSEIDISGFNAKWGKRALGGPVMGGRSYLVGEQGPELFVPRQAGQIVPSGAGEAPVVNINIQATDAAGFDALLVRRSPLLERMVQNAFERRGKRGLK